MIIDVNQGGDILRRKRHKNNACPVALAVLLKRTINPISRNVSVIPATMPGRFYHNNSEMNRLRLSDKTTEFIADFDAGNIVAPFSFEIDDLPTLEN